MIVIIRRDGLIGNLSLDQLRILVAVVDAGGFSAAGRSLSRVQSAISQSVAALEETQGITLFERKGRRVELTAVGRTLVDQARLILAGVARFEAVAAGTRSGVEPELAIAIDPFVPTAPLIESLRGLNKSFPDMPVKFSTEGLGGAVRRLQDGSASLALCLLLHGPPKDIVSYPLMKIRLQAVVARQHPLADICRPISQWELEPYVQLVLSDPEDGEGSYGLSTSRLWRFVDLARRLDFLLAGFGWCRMPEHLVAAHVAGGELVALEIEADPTPPEGLTIYAAHRRDQRLGPAARRLLDGLQKRAGMDKK
jgi:DNA-binding transcriptional LysR family regulator